MFKKAKKSINKEQCFVWFGFNMMEIIVVVTIFGMISSVIFVAISDIRNKALNVKRLDDIENIREALRFYKKDIGSYPLVFR